MKRKHTRGAGLPHLHHQNPHTPSPPGAHPLPPPSSSPALKAAVSARSPRGTVAYVNGELWDRLAGATDWVTALKTLMVFHRLMRESDASYLDDLLRLGVGGNAAARAGGGGGGGGGGNGYGGSRPIPPPPASCHGFRRL